MNENSFNMHYVTTRKEALQLALNREGYWLSTCGCRISAEEERGVPCARSSADVCLFWTEKDYGGYGSERRKVSFAQVEELFKVAAQKHLVTRPFRSDPNETDGVCFCCDDCCGYFNADDDACDKGIMMENTVMDNCTHCGDCVSVCYFGGRQMDDEQLVVDRKKCFGCGLCLDVCPPNCIEMVER